MQQILIDLNNFLHRSSHAQMNSPHTISSRQGLDACAPCTQRDTIVNAWCDTCRSIIQHVTEYQWWDWYVVWLACTDL